MSWTRERTQYASPSKQANQIKTKKLTKMWGNVQHNAAHKEIVIPLQKWIKVWSEEWTEKNVSVRVCYVAEREMIKSCESIVHSVTALVTRFRAFAGWMKRKKKKKKQQQYDVMCCADGKPFFCSPPSNMWLSAQLSLCFSYSIDFSTILDRLYATYTSTVVEKCKVLLF